jgi:enamine deaminase RidA (YjgF/YER057c/UK114 family)
MSVEDRLGELGLELPEMAKPAGAYVPAKRTGNLIYVSGQLPLKDGELVCKGVVGKNVSVDEAYAGARQCGLNILAVLKEQAGSLDNIVQIVRLEGFVASAEGFTDQAKVINGASELFAEVLEEAGSHARFAVGAIELPLFRGECGDCRDC